MEEQLLNAIKVCLNKEISPLVARLINIEAQMKVRQELSQEHNVLARLRKVEEMQAHLTGKIMVFSAMFSALIGVVLKLMSMK